MNIVNLILNGLLSGACIWCLYQINGIFDHPYAFTASIFGLMHGLMALIEAGLAGPCSQTNKKSEKIQSISRSIVDIISMPLVDIEIYNLASNTYAMAHLTFLIPLFFEFVGKYTGGTKNSTDVLKSLTLMASVGSLVYLSLQEAELPPWWLGLAGAAFASRFLTWLAGCFRLKFAPLIPILANAAFFALTAEVVGGSNRK